MLNHPADSKFPWKDTGISDYICPFLVSVAFFTAMIMTRSTILVACTLVFGHWLCVYSTPVNKCFISLINDYEEPKAQSAQVSRLVRGALRS